PIRYRDFNRLWYISHCRIERNPSIKGGLAVHTDGQELVSSKPAQEPSSLPASAPRPYLEVEDSIGAAFGKTAFKFTNRGGEVAHNVQVQPFVADHLTVVFDLIPTIPKGEERSTIPNIPGRGIMQQHDVLSLMVREWDAAFANAELADKDRIEEWSKEIVITYEDYAGKRFEATMELVVFPIERTMRDRNAFGNPHQQYKTVEVRKIKFRPLQ
ncbi:MAG TPA: hypothetical protein VJN64_13670, partial [Terriglobales bacterium]|nr:hypothetical protein [Terriglobales bacterium]